MRLKFVWNRVLIPRIVPEKFARILSGLFVDTIEKNNKFMHARSIVFKNTSFGKIKFS